MSDGRATTAATNGQLGGRPRVKTGPRELRRRAQRLGERACFENVRLLVRIRDGLVAGATVGDRVRAIENLLDRFGFPRQSQSQMLTDQVPKKLFDLRLPGAESGAPATDGPISNGPLPEVPTS